MGNRFYRIAPIFSSRFVVILAQAGIQWFIAYIPAQAGMTTWVIPASVTGATGLTSRPALLDSGLRRNDGFVWIPAFARRLRASSAARSRPARGRQTRPG